MMIMIIAKIKKSFLVISSPPFGGKHSTVKVFLCELHQNVCPKAIDFIYHKFFNPVKTITGGKYDL